MSSTRPSLARMMLIHQAIAGRRYPSLDDLALLCQVHPRTIKRDLRTLREEFDAPVCYAREEQGFYYTNDFTLATPPLTEGEILALSMMSTFSSVLENTPFAPAVHRALQKLLVMLPEEAQQIVIQDGLIVSSLPDPAPPEKVETAIFFNQLLHAIDRNRRVRITYYTLSRDATTTREVDPYHLYFRRGMWYVHGFCHHRRTTRDFALSRISALEPLSATFPAPDREAVRATLAQRFSLMHDSEVAEVTVQFDAETARLIRERRWHPTQSITDTPDGGCRLTMTVSGMDSVIRWVLGFGRHARVLAPPALVRRVREEIRLMAAQPE